MAVMTRSMHRLIMSLIVLTMSSGAQAGPRFIPSVGEVIHFYGFQNPVGCRNARMATKIGRMQEWERQNFADSLRLRGEQDTTCALLRERDDQDWRIAAFEYDRNGALWVCVESTIDLRPADEVRRNPGPDPNDCYWIKTTGRKL